MSNGRGTVFCKSCGAPILFVRLKSGKYTPVDVGSSCYVVPDDSSKDVYVSLDGDVIHGRKDKYSGIAAYTSHFATCPAANNHRKRGRRENGLT